MPISILRSRCLMLFLAMVPVCLMAQNTIASLQSPKYTRLAQNFLDSLTAGQKGQAQVKFDDTIRLHWQRVPGQRQGLKMDSLTEGQKIAFHELMRNCLSSQGYLKVTSVMFNEDIQKKFEPNIGRGEFWVEVFGQPAAGGLWGWKIEGHHLTVNFTFRGDKMISHTPFLIGSNPANGKTDSVRAGLLILHNEDELARRLVNSFNETQLREGYTHEKRPEIVYGEKDRQHINVPPRGIFFNKLSPAQQAVLRSLVEEYINDFHPAELPSLNTILNSNAKFFYMDRKDAAQPYYYRIMNGNILIECENYGNHIHCFWRSGNDFGKEKIRGGASAGAGIAGTMSGPELASSSFVVDTIATDLYVPWDIVFLPDNSMLFTERPGRVRLYRNHALIGRPLLTIPDIEVKGKMGLLGMRLHPRYASNHLVYLAYNYRVGDQTFLRVARYTMTRDSLVEPFTIIEKIPGVFNHTGCRLVFGKEDKLFITTGDADVPRLAQDLRALNGKILRLNDDGSIPADNPFVKNDTARHEIWTYGHRNPQGLAIQPSTGFLYDSEHGPTGGDEINLIHRGNNYGWPVIHHRDTRDGMMAPLMEFSPSIGPAEALFYSGRAFPEMKGNLLVACMRGEAILRVRFSNNRIGSYDFLYKKQYGRIRALAEGPDGALYFSTSQLDPPESNTRPGDHGYDLIVRLCPFGGAAGKKMGGKTDPQVTAVPGQEAMMNRGLAGPLKKGPSGHDAAHIYAQLCAGCHGADLNGKDDIPSLTDAKWLFGGSKIAIQRSIAQGVVAKGMPSWEGVLTPAEIGRIADYIMQQGKKK